MAVARTLQHRSLTSRLMEHVAADRFLHGRRLKRGHLALMMAAILAGTLLSFSLVFDPPEMPPPATSYLPRAR